MDEFAQTFSCLPTVDDRQSGCPSGYRTTNQQPDAQTKKAHQRRLMRLKTLVYYCHPSSCFGDKSFYSAQRIWFFTAHY